MVRHRSPKSWVQPGDSQKVKVSANSQQGQWASPRQRQQQWQHPSPGSSGFHHSDDRHGLRAGGLGYPNTARVVCLGPGLGAEVAMTDLLFYQVFHPVVHL